MVTINFYDKVEDSLLKFAVMVSRHNGRWVLCRHKSRNTYEWPGGHREPDETILDCAKRELWEETGAIKYNLFPVCVYSVVDEKTETFGMLYFAEIFEFEPLPQLEIENIEFFDELPQESDTWTYYAIQPKLTAKIREVLNI